MKTPIYFHIINTNFEFNFKEIFFELIIQYFLYETVNVITYVYIASSLGPLMLYSFQRHCSCLYINNIIIIIIKIIYIYIYINKSSLTLNNQRNVLLARQCLSMTDFSNISSLFILSEFV